MTRPTRPLVLLLYVAVAGVLLGVIAEFAVSQFRGETVNQDVLNEAEPETYALPPQEDRLPVEALDGIPPYPNVDEQPRALSRKMLAQGLPMDTAWFTTDDPPGQVLSYYQAHFADAGLHYVSDMFSEASGYAGYMELDTERMHIVSAIRQGDKTVVFPSVGEPGKLLDGSATLPDDVPVAKDAQSNFVMEFRDEGRTQQTISSNIPTGTVEQVAEFYRSEFTQKGWTVSAPRDTLDGEGTDLTAEQQGKVAHVSIRRDPKLGAGVFVFINLTRGAS